MSKDTFWTIVMSHFLIVGVIVLYQVDLLGGFLILLLSFVGFGVLICYDKNGNLRTKLHNSKSVEGKTND